MKPIILTCANCKDSLQITEGSVLFYCPGCSKWYEESDGALRPETFIQMKGPKSNEVDFYLPFRVFTLTTSVQGENKERCNRAQKFADTFSTVFVQAFGTRGFVDYFDWGMEYTREMISVEGTTVTTVENLGLCSRTNSDCWPFARAYMMAFIDEKVDITDLEVNCSATSPRLVAFPFSVENNYVLDCTLGKRALKVYLEAIPDSRSKD